MQQNQNLAKKELTKETIVAIANFSKDKADTTRTAASLSVLATIETIARTQTAVTTATTIVALLNLAIALLRKLETTIGLLTNSLKTNSANAKKCKASSALIATDPALTLTRLRSRKTSYLI